MNPLLPAVAVLIAVFILTVLNAPAWLIKTGAFGGLAFVVLAVMLLILWLIDRLKRKP